VPLCTYNISDSAPCGARAHGDNQRPHGIAGTMNPPHLYNTSKNLRSTCHRLSHPAKKANRLLNKTAGCRYRRPPRLIGETCAPPKLQREHSTSITANLRAPRRRKPSIQQANRSSAEACLPERWSSTPIRPLLRHSRLPTYFSQRVRLPPLTPSDGLASIL